MTYRIDRLFEDGNHDRGTRTGLTLEQAQEHCQDRETSSKTCEHDPHANRGRWFDSYTEE